MPVNYFTQPTAFLALNRKACETHRDGTTALQGEQQHNVNSAGHTFTDNRKKSKGLVIAVFASAVWMNNTPRSIKVLPFTHFPSLKVGWRTARSNPGLPLPG